jgi:hypothetical protein
MTMHATVLPGYQPHPTTCRDRDCDANLGIVNCRVYRMARWKSALKSGPDAIASHLAQYNRDFKNRHRPGCPFSDLPPAVHASCEGYDDQGRDAFDQLRYWLQELTDCRAREN